MLSATPDAAAARFALLTGAAPDLESDLIPFGRVIEGLAVVDALEAGDRIGRPPWCAPGRAPSTGR